MLTHLEPYLLAPSALPPTALLARLVALTTDPALHHALAGGPPAVALRSNPIYDAWLLRWTDVERSDVHGHGDAYGAYAVLAGSFCETVAGPDALAERRLTAGAQVAYRPGYVHRLVPLAPDAVSLHLSSPPRHTPSCLTALPAAAASG